MAQYLQTILLDLLAKATKEQVGNAADKALSFAKEHWVLSAGGFALGVCGYIALQSAASEKLPRNATAKERKELKRYEYIIKVVNVVAISTVAVVFLVKVAEMKENAAKREHEIRLKEWEMKYGPSSPSSPSVESRKKKVEIESAVAIEQAVESQKVEIEPAVASVDIEKPVESRLMLKSGGGGMKRDRVSESRERQIMTELEKLERQVKMELEKRAYEMNVDSYIRETVEHKWTKLPTPPPAQVKVVNDTNKPQTVVIRQSLWNEQWSK